MGSTIEVFAYLSRFTAWRPYQHRVKACVDGQLLPMPINLDTINQLFGLNLSAFEVEGFLASRAAPRAQIRTSEDVVVSKVGRELYQKFFQGYTRKQWGLDPSELDASVTARVPTRTNRDDRYFTDTYQAMPLHGYTRITEFKYLTGQEHAKTSIVYEYPRAEGDPYYPVPRPENALLYEQYKALAEATPDVHFVGRLATYKYYNMDQVVAQALKTYRTIREGESTYAEQPALLEVSLGGLTPNTNGKARARVRR